MSVEIDDMPFPDDSLISPEEFAINLPKEGFCLITAGAVDAGKSTLQNALIHQLYVDGGVTLEFKTPDGANKIDPTLQEWINRFQRGEFPSRTPKGLLQTFFIEFRANARPARLSFVEISGEYFRELLPKMGQLGHEVRLPKEVEHILTSKRVKKLFIFVSDVTKRQDQDSNHSSKEMERQAFFEDMMFDCFLGHLQKLGVRRLRLLFVVSKWDAAENRNMKVSKYFSVNFPQTQSKLKQFHKPHIRYMPFSIGDIRAANESSNGIEIPKIVNRDSVPIKRIIQWIHYNTSGKGIPGYPTMQMTLWERIKALLS